MKKNNSLLKELEEFVNNNRLSYFNFLRNNNEKYLHLKKFIEEYVHGLPIDSDEYSWSTKCYWTLHQLKDFQECPMCHKKIGVGKNVGIDGYRTYCSAKCEMLDPNVQKKYRDACLEKYGCESTNQVESIKEKKRLTCIEHFGVDHQFKSKKIREKINTTLKDRYGVSNAYQIEKSVNNRRKISLERYGTEYPIENEKVHDLGIAKKIEKYGSLENLGKITYERSLQTKIEKYGSLENFLKLNGEKIRRRWIDKRYSEILLSEYVEPLFSLDQFDNSFCKQYHWKCKKCGKEFESVQQRSEYGFFARCSDCYPISQSTEQIEVEEFVKTICEHVTTNDRLTISPKELDIYVPNRKLAIEFDGLYWHSLGDKMYHLNKTNTCEVKGIHLVHIFENEWLFKKDIVKSRLKNLFGIYDNKCYARQCEVRNVDSIESKTFQEENHIQGMASSTTSIGLYFNEKLISLMTFSKPRFSKKYEWELVRFCNKLGWHVPGAASKLLRFFEDKYHPKSIVSYADRRWTMNNGNTVYDKLGFTLYNISKPNYWYFKNNSLQLESRVKYQKHKLQKLLEKFNPSKTEFENMTKNNYHRIYDCGNLVFVKTYE